MNEGKPTNATPAMGAEEYLVRMHTALATNGDSKPIKGANRTRNLIITNKRELPRLPLGVEARSLFHPWPTDRYLRIESMSENGIRCMIFPEIAPYLDPLTAGQACAQTRYRHS
jgi:hypothetical protein